MLVCIDSLGRSIYTDGRWVRKDNAVAVDTVVELMAAVKSAEQKGVALYTAYLRTTETMNNSDEIRLKSSQDVGKITLGVSLAF